MFYKVLYIPGGAGFLPSTLWINKIWHSFISPKRKQTNTSKDIETYKHDLLFYQKNQLMMVL